MYQKNIGYIRPINILGIVIFMGFFVSLFFSSPVFAAGKCCIYYTQPLLCDFDDTSLGAFTKNCYFVNQSLSCSQASETDPICNKDGVVLQAVDGIVGRGDLDSDGQACPQIGQVNLGGESLSLSVATISDENKCDTYEGYASFRDEFTALWNEKYKPISVQGTQTTGVCRCVTASEIVHCAKEIPLSFDYKDSSQKEEVFQAKLIQACKDYSIGNITCEPYPGQTMNGGMSSAVVAEPKCTYDFGQKGSGNKDGDIKTGAEFSLPSSNALNLLGTTDIRIVIGRMMKIAMGVMGSLALVIIIYGGLLWMTAAGNSEREGKALKVMFTAGVGVVIILSSYAIVTFVFSTL